MFIPCNNDIFPFSMAGRLSSVSADWLHQKPHDQVKILPLKKIAACIRCGKNNRKKVGKKIDILLNNLPQC
jgi:hypothetical protein